MPIDGLRPLYISGVRNSTYVPRVDGNVMAGRPFDGFDKLDRFEITSIALPETGK